MKTRRFTALASAAALLLAALLSCGEGTSAAPDNTENDDTAPATEAVSARPDSGLPDMDFGGAVYRISTYSEGDLNALYAKETNGEAVNDAIYERNSALEEKYNFTFDTRVTNSEYNAHTKEIANLVLANEDAYELVCGHVVATCNNAIAGYYQDLHEVPYLDFSKPWWPAQSVDEMTIYGRMFTICSGITYIQLANAKVIFFNKELLSANDLPLPYDLVRDGKWTIDKLIAQTKGLYQDVNGDGVRGLEDMYGYTTYPSQNGFLVSCKTPVLSPTEDGGREITVMTGRTSSLVEQLYSWYYESGDAFLAVSDTSKDDYVGNVFGNGHAAYAFSLLKVANQHYRNDNIVYGVVPQPKFDEAQDDYYVFACPSLFSIPLSTENLDFAGFIFEAMTYTGYYDVIPMYYEITLKGKVADSPDDMEMLEIINDHLTVSFAYCYDNWQGFAHLLNSRLGFTQTEGSKDLASMYETYLPSAQARLDAILDGFDG